MSEITYSTSSQVEHNKLNELFIKIKWHTRFNWKWVLESDNNLYTITAWHEKELVGMGRLFKIEDKCYIYDLVVDPSFQRKHIATNIVEKLERKAKELNYKKIFTDSENQNAQKLFIKYGYSEIKTDKKINSSALFYMKELI